MRLPRAVAPLLRGRLALRDRRLSANIPPPAMLALMYLATIVAGTLILRLPGVAARDLTWMESVFTATSAVTVTGLSLIETGQDLTVWGQGAVLALIQLGGLGLMTFAALILSALGLPIGMPQRVILREDLNQTSIANLLLLVRLILKAALICEAAGTALLALVFVPDLGWGAGLWAAAFTTVSAFNNAGFALWPDSLSRWVADPIVALAVPAMWLIGGLGFIVIADLLEKRRWQALTLHTRLMLVGSLALSLFGILAFGALEWTNSGTLGALDGAWARIAAAIFQGLTPRTAGFNTVDVTRMHDATAFLTIALMVIGGGSTSTAGGIKVTSAIVLVLATVAFFRRRDTLHAFGRSIGVEEVLKVMALTTVSTLVIVLGVFVVTLGRDGAFLDSFFEVASAFGTVGLTLGATAELDTAGRIAIMVLMFVGRVGPLTLGFFLATRSSPRVRYPSSRIYLG
ncbi:MAG: TrkH family potassium uptake protein [Tranquillimonas sp.]